MLGGQESVLVGGLEALIYYGVVMVPVYFVEPMAVILQTSNSIQDSSIRLGTD